MAALALLHVEHDVCQQAGVRVRYGQLMARDRLELGLGLVACRIEGLAAERDGELVAAPLDAHDLARDEAFGVETVEHLSEQSE